MKLTFYADLHLCGPHAIEGPLVFGKETYYIGDIVDVKNAPKKKVAKAKERLAKIIELADGNYVSGNHELINTHLRIIKDGVLILHGDEIFYTKEKFEYWRNGAKKAGKGKLFRFWLGVSKKFAKHGGLGKEKQKLAAAFAKKHNCHTIIFGHKHPKKLVDVVCDDVRVICCPRGKTTIEL